jgi:ribosome recycling factor
MSKSVFGAIIDAPIEEVDNLLKKSNYNITVLINFKKGLELLYLRVEAVKNEILDRMKKGDINEKIGNEEVKQLYIALQKIEDRATLIQSYITDKKIDFKN